MKKLLGILLLLPLLAIAESPYFKVRFDHPDDRIELRNESWVHYRMFVSPGDSTQNGDSIFITSFFEDEAPKSLLTKKFDQYISNLHRGRLLTPSASGWTNFTICVRCKAKDTTVFDTIRMKFLIREEINYDTEIQLISGVLNDYIDSSTTLEVRFINHGFEAIYPGDLYNLAFKELNTPFYRANRYFRYKGPKLYKGDSSIMYVTVGREIVESRWFTAKADSFCIFIQRFNGQEIDLDLYADDNYACGQIEIALPSQVIPSKLKINKKGNVLRLTELNPSCVSVVQLVNLRGQILANWQGYCSDYELNISTNLNEQMVVLRVSNGTNVDFRKFVLH